MKNIPKFVLVIILLSSITISYIFGRKINISSQVSVFGILKDISITIFTIMGIWLAMLQTDKLRKIFNIGETIVLNHSEQVWLSNILEPILISSLTLIIIVIMSMVNILLKPIVYCLDIIIALRECSLFILIILSILNIYAVIISMKPIIVIFLNIIGSKNKIEKIYRNIPQKNIVKKR